MMYVMYAAVQENQKVIAIVMDIHLIVTVFVVVMPKKIIVVSVVVLVCLKDIVIVLVMS